MSSITQKAVLENLESLIDWFWECLEATGWSQKRKLELRLAVEEAVVNVMRYAYPGDPGDVALDCSCDESRRVVIRITDWGTPFDLLSIGDPDLTLDVADRSIGGLGVHLIRKLVDSVEYVREPDRNVLTLVIENEAGE